MIVTERVEQLIAPTVEDMGFSIVRVQLSGGDRLQLQVMVERQDGQAMVVDNCADLSRAISAILDVEDPIADAYTLEVSSPGIDRPLVRLRDFERFAGHEARIETNVSVNGRRRFRGRVLGIEGDVVRVAVEGEDIEVPFSAISKAKLVLTDELLGISEGRQGR
ncbi:MAG: ribosome maturation factor RimP [Rhodospirillales bacterium]|nr:ribosome maturation factor RimP [Rhodospirillales bacterium]